MCDLLMPIVVGTAFFSTIIGGAVALIGVKLASKSVAKDGE